MVKLWATDRQRALGRIETAQRLTEAITTRIAADEDQVVRLVLVGDAASPCRSRRARSECAPGSRNRSMRKFASS